MNNIAISTQKDILQRFVSRIFEKIIQAILTKINTLFSDTQYGYRSGCSAEFASMEFTDCIYNHIGFSCSYRKRSIPYITIFYYTN